MPTNAQDSQQQHHHYTEWYSPSLKPPAPPNPWDIERRVSLLERSTKDIKEELGKINNNLSKILWIILGAIIVSILNLVLRGAA